MKFEIEVDSLICKFASKMHEIESENNFHITNQELASVYFVSLRQEFDVIKKVIQCISGSLLLTQCGIKQNFSSPVSVIKCILDETIENIEQIKVPGGLQKHYKHLLDAIHTLNNVFVKYSLVKDLFYLSKKQIEEILMVLRFSFENLKKASSFSLGLGMISLESSCACGLH